MGAQKAQLIESGSEGLKHVKQLAKAGSRRWFREVRRQGATQMKGIMPCLRI